ncbi:hypothetical protein [Hymenobacter rubidus]|uniref:hypothetical protein n=1 Tax=Hymenobacter rubidus TaxID=1441626 RepID=UPI00191CA7BA|nr:hypothetical protein [Hymenobacter rubidus]
MDALRTFTGNTEAEIWQQVAADMAQRGEWFEYEAVLQQGGYEVYVAVDIDLGGGFESGSESTTMTARLPRPVPLRFALHEQDWVHELGKLLGLTDIELGDPEIDAAFIITTNEPATLHDLLADPDLRHTLLRYRDLRLVLKPTGSAPDEEAVLEFSKDTALTDPAQLQDVYHLLLTLLQKLAPLPASTAASL